jgi:hypothetical protein
VRECEPADLARFACGSLLLFTILSPFFPSGALLLLTVNVDDRIAHATSAGYRAAVTARQLRIVNTPPPERRWLQITA